MQIDAFLNQGLEYHRQGQLNEAAQLYERVLAADPNCAGAWNLLGAVHCQYGHFNLAAEYIARATQLDPRQASFFSNLGETYRRWGKQADAQACFEHALKLDPQQPEALNNLGIIYQAQGKLAEATRCYELVLRLKPHGPEGYSNLGTLYQDQGELDSAIACFRKALELNPAYATAYNNLGAVLIRQSRHQEALGYLEKCLELNPNYTEALNNLGSVWQAEGEFTKAEPCFRKAIEALPGYEDALVNLAACLRSLGRTEEAAEAFDRAIAVVGKDGLRIKAAIAISALPRSIEEIADTRAQLAARVDALLGMDLHVGDPIKEMGHNHFYLAYHGQDDREINVRIAELERHACPALTYDAPHCNSAYRPDPARPLRIGIASAYFHQHSVGRLMRGIIGALSRERFHVTVVRLPGIYDSWSARIDASADEVLNVTPRLETAQRQIAERQFDILWYADIGMDPLGYFLAFARLAPVQCSSWGHPVTSGVSTVDYFISSKLLEPADGAEHYSEKLVELSVPPTYFAPPDVEPSTKSLADFGIDRHGTLYFCPQSLFKLHPEFDILLERILSDEPESKLVLVSAKDPSWPRAILERFRRTMPTTWSRVEFVSRQSTADLMRLMQLADVLLDTIHFSGGLTSLESFHVGRPVVTLPGRFMRGRVTHAYYQQMGLTDCVAADADDYVRLALRLARDRTWREEQRAAVLQQRWRLYHDPQIVGELEAFFLGAVQKRAGS